jgi:hypothetical protein
VPHSLVLAPPRDLAGNCCLLHPLPEHIAAGLTAVERDKQPAHVSSAGQLVSAGMAGKALASVRNALSKIRIMAPWRVRHPVQHEDRAHKVAADRLASE